MERRTEAEVAMKVLRGDSYNPNEEITIIESEKEEASSKKTTFLDIFRTVGSRRAFICSCGGMLFQQLSGVNAVIFNTLEIFQAAGSSLPSDVAAIIVSVVQVNFSRDDSQGLYQTNVIVFYLLPLFPLPSLSLFLSSGDNVRCSGGDRGPSW